MYKFRIKVISILICSYFSLNLMAQTASLPLANLTDIVQYSLIHQASVEQAKLDQQIVKNTSRSAQSAWLPQVAAAYNFQHDYQLNGGLPSQRLENNSTIQLNANQTLFNRELWRVSAIAKTINEQALTKLQNQYVNTVHAVSKAYYDVLLAQQKTKLVVDDIRRLEQSLAYSKARFESGLVDRSDFQRATIALNNAKAQRQINENNLEAATHILKEQMGYPQKENLTLDYDSIQLLTAVNLAPQGEVNFNNRLEYKNLLLQKELNKKDLTYSKLAYLPNVALFAGHNWNFTSDNLTDHFKQVYPALYIGLNVNVPIFQGNKRNYDIRIAQLKLKRVDQDIRLLENAIDTDYGINSARYNSNYINYTNQKDNLTLAKEVYQLIQFQYEQGVKAYIELVTAETDLRYAEINYWTALFETLKSKLDVEKTLGTIRY